MKRLLTTTALVAMTAMPLAAEQHSNANSDMSVTAGENEMRVSSLMDATVYMPQEGDTSATDSGPIGEVPDSWTEIGKVSDVFVDKSGNVSTVVLTPNDNADANAGKLGLMTDSVSFKPGENDNEFFVVYTGDKVSLSESEEFDAAQAESEGMTSVNDQQNADMNRENGQTGDMQNAETQKDGLTIRAADLSGHAVYIPGEGSTGDEIPMELTEADDTWERVGEIGGVIISRDGNIKSVTLDAGGFLGMNEKNVETTMDELRFVRDSDSDADNEWFVVFTGDRSALEQRDEYDERASEQQGDQYMSNDDMAANDTQSGTGNQSGDMAANQSSDQMNEGSDSAAVTDQDATTNSDTGSQTQAENDGMSESAADPTLIAEDLDGAPVYDSTGEEIGNVSSLVMNDNGEVSKVVIDVGGFLGLGEKPVAIPYEDLQIDESVDTAYGDVRVSVNHTQAELEEMETWSE